MTIRLLKITQQSLSVKRVISIKSKFFVFDLQGQRHGKPDYSLGKVSVWVLIIRDNKSVSGTFVNMSNHQNQAAPQRYVTIWKMRLEIQICVF